MRSDSFSHQGETYLLQNIYWVLQTHPFLVFKERTCSQQNISHFQLYFTPTSLMYGVKKKNFPFSTLNSEWKLHYLNHDNCFVPPQNWFSFIDFSDQSHIKKWHTTMTFRKKLAKHSAHIFEDKNPKEYQHPKSVVLYHAILPYWKEHQQIGWEVWQTGPFFNWYKNWP